MALLVLVIGRLGWLRNIDDVADLISLSKRQFETKVCATCN